MCCRNKRTLCSRSWPPPRGLFPVCHHDGTHKERSTFADYVRGWCGAVRKGEMRPGVGTGAVVRKRVIQVSRANTEYICLNGTPLGSVKMQSAQLSHFTGFKYLGSTLQCDGYMNTEANKRTQCGLNHWRRMSGVLCDKRIPPHVKMIVQPARQKSHREVRKARLVQLFGHVKRQVRPRTYASKNLVMVPPGRRTRGILKHRRMDCVNRDMRAIGTTKDEVRDRNGCPEENCVCRSNLKNILQISIL